jgi:tripartite-type tricarboxylate transporter receptor subunit TctC
MMRHITGRSHRRALVLTLGLLSVTTAGWGQAPAYPNKPVKILVPFVAGGTSDIVARAIAQKLNESGYTTVVENRPGANGSLAAEATAKSPNDGYTLLVGSIGTFAINMSLYKNPKYDVMRDFEAVTVAVRTPNVLITPPGLPANNLKEFIAYAKANPGKVSYGSSGSGSSDHLSAELFKQQTDTFGVHIPYRGGAAAQMDIMAGNIEASFQNFGTVVPYIRSGKMKALAVTSRERMPQLPNVPTVIESGLPNFDVTSWQAVVAPKGTPRDIVAKLQADIAKGLRSTEISQRFKDQGFEVVANTPEQASAFFKSEIDRWAVVVKASGATVD